MYCKLFASLYQGTLRGKAHEILVFTNLLAYADAKGIVDKHFKAIAEEVGLTIDEVKAAVASLEAPDSESRSPDYKGARLLRLDDHRTWGWRIVNYLKYRSIRNEEDRAEQNRLAQQRWRARVSKISQRKPESAENKPDKPKQKKEAEERGEKNPPSLKMTEKIILERELRDNKEELKQLNGDTVLNAKEKERFSYLIERNKKIKDALHIPL